MSHYNKIYFTSLHQVPVKFRYPFYTEILWYVVQRFVHCLLGKNYLICNESGEYLDHANEPASDALNLSSTPDKDPKLLSVTHNPMHLNGDKFSFPFKGIGDSLQQETSNGIKPEASNPDTSSDAKPVVPSADGNSMSCPESNMPKNGPKEHIHITTLEYNGLKVKCGYIKGLIEFFFSKLFFLNVFSFSSRRFLNGYKICRLPKKVFQVTFAIQMVCWKT